VTVVLKKSWKQAMLKGGIESADEELCVCQNSWQERRFIVVTIQITVDDTIKTEADSLFNDLGLDISTAVRMFLSASIANDGIPFAIERRRPNADLLEAITDTRSRHNLHGPYKTAEEAVAAMLED
jgi:DNA-damage-inducible protein J